jgi:hypothetical protein
MRKRIDENVLRLGDVIFTTSDALVSKAIRTATKSSISHAMLYVEHCSVIDATADGVHASNTQRLFFEQDNNVIALRFKEGLTQDTATNICNFVRERVGSEYSVMEAGRAWKGSKKKGSYKQFCSRLVAQAYSANGIDLVANSDFCTPEELLNSEKLVSIPNATANVTEDEYQRWLAHPSGLDMMRNSTNYVLNEARKIDASIQHLSDIDKLVLEHPEHDQTIAQAFIDSEYLEVWKVNYQANPWQYDPKLLEEFGNQNPEDVRWYCEGTVSEGSRTDNRYVQNAQVYQNYVINRPGKTMMLLFALYQKLAENHVTRLEIAENWLARNYTSGSGH